MKKRLIVTVLTLLLGLITTSIVNSAVIHEEEYKPTLTEPVEHHVPEEIHEEIHAEPHAVVPTPKMYYFYWTILGITLLTIVTYFYKIHRELPQHETKTLAIILVILGMTLYFLDQLPSVATYHEPTVIGLIKFVYRMVLGILFTVYAFFGIHEEHKL